MKTKNKIISIAMCLCIALLSGCSQGGGGQQGTGTAGGVSTPAAGNAGGNTETGGANTEVGADDVNTSSNDENVTTEQVNKPTDEKLAYLDLLSEEYEKCGRLYGVGGTSCVNGKIIIIKTKTKNNTVNKMTVYDVGKKEKKEITLKTDAWLSNNNNFVYDDKNGYIYAFEDGRFYKFDSSGNLIGQIEADFNITTVFPDGTCFVGNNMYSSDWETVTELPVLQADVAHGLKKDVENYEIVAAYKNKVYALSNESETRGYYCLNTDTKTWEKVKSELNISSNSYHYWGVTNIVGKYWLISGAKEGERKASTMVYDMETDTVVANIAAEGYIYNGRDYELGLWNGVLTKYQYPGDGSEAVSETIIDTGDKKLYFNYFNNGGVAIVPFDEQYYVYQDDYGIFLREYGKGEEGEITVYMFEQQ